MGDGDEFPSRIYVITSKCRDLLQFDVEISREKDEKKTFSWVIFEKVVTNFVKAN